MYICVCVYIYTRIPFMGIYKCFYLNEFCKTYC